MKKRKVLKILKIILITLLIILIIFAAAVALIYNFAIRPHIEEIENAVEVVVNDEEIMNKIEPYLGSETVEKLIQNGELQPESQSEQEKVQEKAQEKTETTPEKKPKKSVSDYASRYDYVKDNVEPSDFARGVSLAGRIDVGYILGLLSGGLTSEEKQELKGYLQSHFSSAEIAEGISLYSKYSDLLK